MVFIVILLALALERYFDWSHLRSWQWLDRYGQILSPYVSRLNLPLRLASYILLPVILVGLIEFILSGWLYGFLRFLFDFIVLLYCFGPTNLWVQIYGCLQPMQQGDGRLVDERVKATFPLAIANNSQTLHQALIRTIFVEGYHRVFAVVFWFAILGPMGAVLYRMTALTHGTTSSELASLSARALEILDWVPARLLGIIFALGGHFVKVLGQWQKYVLQGLHTSEIIIAETGVSALDFVPSQPLSENGETEKAALLLFDRALIIMLVISAIVVLVLP